MKRIGTWGVLILLVVLSMPAFAQKKHPCLGTEGAADVYSGQLGTVTLPFSCNSSNRELAERSLALLHHMTYVGARAGFVELTAADPDCAMGYWGQAMSYIHPLWSDPPSETDFKKGKSLLATAKRRVKNTREKAFVAAAAAYYDAGRQASEQVNLMAFEEGWRKAYQQFPDDVEAASFYALSHMATASAGDKSYAKQKRSAEIARQVLKQVPAHPGGHHYAIHALDYPPLASEAVAVARSYGNIAPDIPHALHMPAHIFTRLGLWQESIDMNRRSADAALQHPANGKISLHYLHALDYLAYAYLQRGQDDEANQVLAELNALKGPYQTHVASAYSFAAIPARIALERQQWTTAAKLKAQKPAGYAWQTNPAMEAITAFANGIGAVRSGDAATAQRAIKELGRLEKRAAASSAYWGKQVAIQRMTVEAWLSYLQGQQEQALTTMRQAAQMEAATEKHPVTPGEVLPAHELLADMLLELQRYQEAQSYYRATLERSPNRLNSLYGAGRSAVLAGDKPTAVRYYTKLVDMVADDNRLQRVQQARAFLSKK